MISQATITALEEQGLEYVLGVRERTDARMRRVLDDPQPLTPLLVERSQGETQLFAKEVVVDGVRYIVCRNEAQAEKDREDRQAIIAALDTQLKKGDKALVGNSAYRRYLNTTTRDAFEIDAGKIAEEARYDGIFVLRTNARIFSASGDAALPGPAHCRDAVPCRQGDALDTSDLPFIRCRHPRPRLLLLPRPDAAQGAVRPLHPKPVSNPSGVRSCVISTACRAAKIEKDGRSIAIRTPVSGQVGPVFRAVGVALPPNIAENRSRLTARPSTRGAKSAKAPPIPLKIHNYRKSGV